MGKYVWYDAQNEVIFTDYTGLTLTRKIMEEVLAEYIEVTRKLPRKFFAVSCYQDTRLDPTMTDADYRWAAEELGKYRRGVVRYGLNNPYTSISLRTNTIRNGHQNTNSHIYPTIEDAIAAVRRREKEENELVATR